MCPQAKASSFSTSIAEYDHKKRIDQTYAINKQYRMNVGIFM